MKIKKIAIFVLDITLRGGIERFIANLSQMLEGPSVNITIYSLHKTHDEPLYELPTGTKIVYLTEFKFINFIYKFVTLYGCIKLCFINSLKDSDVTLISTHPIIGIYLYFINKSMLRKTIASEHSTYAAHNVLVRALRVIAYKKVKFVVTQTTNGVSKFKKFGINVVKIPNPCTQFFDGYQWSKKTPNEKKILVCLSVARLEEVKQLEHYIKAARLVKNELNNNEVVFKLVGSGPLGKDLESMVIKEGVFDIFTIYPASKDVNSHYINSDIYIICSKSEAFPMTMLEAMSYGLPVISYENLIGPSEIVKNNINGQLVLQDSPKGIAEQILKYYHNKKSLEVSSEGALKTAKEFDVQSICSKWKRII